MNYENITVQIAEGILTLTLNRPKKLNALCKALLQELQHVLNAHLDNAAVKAVIITGSGSKAFAAGADISEFMEMENAVSASAMSKQGHEVMNFIENYPKPTIAAVNGYALGAGCELAMACHMRVASDNARLGQPEVNLGLIPGYGGTQRMAQLVGKGKAMELCMTGDMIKALEAHRLGLVNHVVSQAELMDKCKGILQKIRTKAPIAISKIVETINANYATCVNGFDQEIADFGACFETEDMREGVSAFLEKRPANFKGK
ncbi:MAG: enoyl-CoA hydratase/isomerase family protein [Chitinophagales bacterium]